MSERKEGWYWVDFCGITECARLSEYGWYVAGMEGTVPESCFNSIGDRIPTPDEPWQCVPKEATQNMSHQGTMALPDPCADMDDAELCWEAMLSAAPKPEDV